MTPSSGSAVERLLAVCPGWRSLVSQVVEQWGETSVADWVTVAAKASDQGIAGSEHARRGAVRPWRIGLPGAARRRPQAGLRCQAALPCLPFHRRPVKVTDAARLPGLGHRRVLCWRTRSGLDRAGLGSGPWHQRGSLCLVLRGRTRCVTTSADAGGGGRAGLLVR